MSATYNFQNSARVRAACEQGATFKRRLTLKRDDGSPVDLSGYTARMQVREGADGENVIAELTSENGRIEIGGAAGTILLHLTATETEALPAGAYTYDLELLNGAGDVMRLAEGRFAVTRNVTR